METVAATMAAVRGGAGARVGRGASASEGTGAARGAVSGAATVLERTAPAPAEGAAAARGTGMFTCHAGSVSDANGRSSSAAIASDHTKCRVAADARRP